MKKKIFFVVVCVIMATLSFAQSSGGEIKRNAQVVGGQISRRGASRTPIHTTKKSKKGGKVSTKKVYPQRDDVFKTNISLPIKGRFDKESLSVTYVYLPSPDFNGHLLNRNLNHKHISLKQISCKQNNITDNEKWYADNQLDYDIETIYGDFEKIRIRCRIKTGGYHVLLLGENYNDIYKVVVTDEKESSFYAAYDFSSFRYAPRRDKSCKHTEQFVEYVFIEGNIMYVSHGGRSGYAIEQGGQKGYITAIDMLTNDIIWTSAPLTSIGRFCVIGNSIIATYGFSEEPKYLFVLDKYSGQCVQKLSLKNTPDDIVVKEKKAYVRTYSLDYVFDIQ